jgi:hypothetical protein
MVSPRHGWSLETVNNHFAADFLFQSVVIYSGIVLFFLLGVFACRSANHYPGAGLIL